MNLQGASQLPNIFLFQTKGQILIKNETKNSNQPKQNNKTPHKPNPNPHQNSPKATQKTPT